MTSDLMNRQRKVGGLDEGDEIMEDEDMPVGDSVNIEVESPDVRRLDDA